MDDFILDFVEILSKCLLFAKMTLIHSYKLVSIFSNYKYFSFFSIARNCIEMKMSPILCKYLFSSEATLLTLMSVRQYVCMYVRFRGKRDFLSL